MNMPPFSFSYEKYQTLKSGILPHHHTTCGRLPPASYSPLNMPVTAYDGDIHA